jgi:alpha-amylase/alpha-mannosidase (GH57 family)
MKLVILWHMHQPFYKDLVSGRYEMPWVRLHGTKDYYDMVAILDQYPNIKQTFNLVPSLLEQIEEYARGEAVDEHLELSRKPASSLDRTNKDRILADFFKVNYETTIAPHKRYAELYTLKNKNGQESFTEKDYRDLQVWSNLVWIDPMFYSSEPIKSLLKKERSFSEQDKAELLTFQQKILNNIIPKYKEMAQKGQIELAISPYFHPILPLLLDSTVTHVTHPQMELPQHHFQRPEDAIVHVSMAVEYFQDKFGFKPRGMWPSEGSVSEQIIPILVDAGIQWIATDEEILALSLGKGIRGVGDDSLIKNGDLYKPYRLEVEKRPIHIFFRDHALSDLIGFVYSRMDPQKAADDFIARLEMIEKNLKANNKPEGIVCVALDGENAWEYFPNDGHDFLKAFYTKLSEHPTIKTTTFSEIIDGTDNIPSLSKLHPGSWINHDFSIWIGHPEDNKAWDLLYEARQELDKHQEGSEKYQLARKEILIAEGSDWCWWFGDEHHSPDNDRFDQLYRSHLKNVYRILGLTIPPVLFKPIRKDFIRAHLLEPVDFIKPKLDGKLTHYYEWMNGGFFDCLKASSTMHKAERILRGIYYGYGKKEEIYIRIDPAVSTDLSSLKIKFELTQPEGLEIVFENGTVKSNKKIEYLDWGFERILEIAFYNKDIGGELSSFRVSIYKGETEIEKWPVVDNIPLRPDLAVKTFWMV